MDRLLCINSKKVFHPGFCTWRQAWFVTISFNLENRMVSCQWGDMGMREFAQPLSNLTKLFPLGQVLSNDKATPFCLGRSLDRGGSIIPPLTSLSDSSTCIPEIPQTCELFPLNSSLGEYLQDSLLEMNNVRTVPMLTGEENFLGVKLSS